jgi:hypothetical protein
MSDSYLKMVVKESYRRNGCAGASFDVAIFRQPGRRAPVQAVLFEAAGHVAVFDLDKLKKDIIEYPENSYRWDLYEAELKRMIEESREEYD